jgi:hypothetical protein
MLEVTGEQGADGAAELAEDGPSFRDLAAQLSCRVKLSPEQVAEMQRQGPLPSLEGDKRRFVRFHLRARGILECRTTLPAIPRSSGRFLVLVKNLSRSGIGFLHEAQLFPRERLKIWVEGRRWLPIEVARCRRLHDGCYEVGGRFV